MTKVVKKIPSLPFKTLQLENILPSPLPVNSMLSEFSLLMASKGNSSSRELKEGRGKAY